MFKKAYRLSPTESFQNAKVYHDSVLSLKVKSQHLTHSRFAVVVSKKVDKRAVVRNRLRRLVHSVILENKFYEKPGYDMLVILKPDSTISEDFTERVRQMLSKAI